MPGPFWLAIFAQEEHFKPACLFVEAEIQCGSQASDIWTPTFIQAHTSTACNLKHSCWAGFKRDDSEVEDSSAEENLANELLDDYLGGVP